MTGANPSGRGAVEGDSDWDLVERARCGEMDAYAELIRRYERPVIHFCQRMVGSREDAEDLAQESFVRVYRYVDRLTPSAKFSTLLFGIARNLTLNFIRDSARRGRGSTYSLTDDENVERSLEDESLRPDRTARLHEIDETIERALSMLTPKHREVLILRELNGLDYGTIAKIVRCRKGTVKSRIARARDQLRRHLETLGGEDL
jgi:RNA polymerase sigma-70 factor (ECF subfamily)